MTVSEPIYPPKSTLHAFLTCRFIATMSTQILAVIVGWHVYDIARSPLALGIVGLVQFAPMAGLILPAGDLADRSDRRLIFSVSFAAVGLCAALLGILAFANVRVLWPFYTTLALFGVARAFAAPAMQSILPLLVPPKEFPKAVAVAASTFQIAVIGGPALGGVVYHFGPGFAFSLCGVLAAASALLCYFLAIPKIHRAPVETHLFGRVTEGIFFIKRTPVLLGAISLDLFAVLLGGAVALMPIYARDILHVGPVGLGVLRSAPAVGAALVGALLMRRPLDRRAGLVMFGSVAGFGLATLVFGLSTSFWLSLGALAVLGACDMVSIYVRNTLVQLATPDEMRGRVNSVNMLFVSASNELGEFESGLLAAWIGVVPCVVVGGLGTLGIVALWMVFFPQLTRVNRLSEIVSGPRVEKEGVG